jgi:hypothetical protein
VFHVVFRGFVQYNAAPVVTPMKAALLGGATLFALAAQQAQVQPFSLSPSDRQRIEVALHGLSAHVAALAARPVDAALLADVAVYQKAAEFILRFPEEFAAESFVADTMSVLDEGLSRARELEAGAPSWPKKKGHVVRAYVSRVDGSVQPYALTIPESYDGTKPMRLDIWQHGTNRTLNEVAFIVQQERGATPANQDYIQLEPLGRTNVSYRWAGEADLFESLASVQQRYHIDPKRIVLRGFSMAAPARGTSACTIRDAGRPSKPAPDTPKRESTGNAITSRRTSRPRFIITTRSTTR